jgi:APA family basic amino acid/polyamine antiporter
MATVPEIVRKVMGFPTATAVIITNMIGTGVFTSLGFQLAGLSSPASILLLWVLGGVVALAGAAVYAELAAVYPRSGGEYNFLGRVYHPLVGFLAGWLSATVGFAAPIALSAKAFSGYIGRVVPWLHSDLTACVCILALAAVHSLSVRRGALFQNLITAVEILVILLLIGFGLGMAAPQPLSLAAGGGFREILSVPFAVSLVFVFFAYSGWNAATYITGEIRNPGRNVPRALIVGTLLVTILYVLLNLTFLRTAPQSELRGVLEVAHVSAVHIFGPAGAAIMSAILALALLSSVSGMSLSGSRIPLVMAEDHYAFRWLRRHNRFGAPARALGLQAAIAVGLVLSGTFEAILTYIGFTLSVCTCLAVAGLFVVRARKLAPEGGYRCWGYPVTPAVFLLLNGWMLAYMLYARPVQSLLGLATVAAGIPVYLLSRRLEARARQAAAAGATVPGLL